MPNEINEVGKVEYYKAFLKVQSEMPDLFKNKKSNRAAYIDLEGIIRHVLPVLHANGLCVEQDLMYDEQGFQYVSTKVIHAISGYVSESKTLINPRDEDFKGKVSYQVYGAGYTYMKRYALISKLCLCADEDTDGVAPSYNKPYNKPASSELPYSFNSGPPQYN